jgi:hypothetical protein
MVHEVDMPIFLSVLFVSLFSVLGFLMRTEPAVAAVSQQTKNAVRSASPILRGTGAIHGGLAGRGFSLLDVKSEIAKSQKLERLTVAIGDAALQPYVGSPGYFHIENKPESHQVIIHFLQALNAKFDEKKLQQTFSKSPFVKSSQMTFEPEAQTMSLVLQMKKSASLRVVPVNGTKTQTAQLKIDMFEDALLQPKAQGQAQAPAQGKSKSPAQTAQKAAPRKTTK